LNDPHHQGGVQPAHRNPNTVIKRDNDGIASRRVMKQSPFERRRKKKEERRKKKKAEEKKREERRRKNLSRRRRRRKNKTDSEGDNV